MQICCNKLYNCNMNSLENILEQHNLRTTKPRQAVFEFLKKHEEPVFIGQIIKECPNIDRVSIYRTIELFEKLGIIQVFHIGFNKGYELAEPFKEHHHHIHCKVCNKITSIKSDKLERTVHKIAEHYNYELSSHHIELWGTCSDCK